MSGHDLKVGDKLAFRIGFRNQWHIETIKKITPSGRIKCGHRELNPDLTVRGRSNSWSGPYCAEILTPELEAEIEAEAKALRIRNRVRSISIRDLTDDQLERIVAILDEPKGGAE